MQDPLIPPLGPAPSEHVPGAGAAVVDVAGLFRAHNAALLRFAAAKLGSEEEAREVVQEAYVRLLQLDRLETVSYLRAFLFKIAANLAKDRLRARRRAPTMDSACGEDSAVFDLSPERQYSGEQLFAAVQSALGELPAKCREIFLLHRIEGLSRKEIAERMGLGERMVRLYMARALEHVRRRMDEISNGEGTAP